MNYRIFPPDDIVEATVCLPYSKSLSARALIINKIGGFITNVNLSDCEDTKILKGALESLSSNIDVRGSGTAMRFLLSYFATCEGSDVIIDGDERMRQRPIGALVEALRHIGAQIEYLGNPGFPPLRIQGYKLSGGPVELDASVSSQFISSLMMIAPRMSQPLTIIFSNEPVSLPYIKMTAAMMQKAGVDTELLPDRVIVQNSSYKSPITSVERDWSAASYWYSITAISAGWITLTEMATERSLQGDSIIQRYGEKLGVLTSISEDSNSALELSASPEQHSRMDLNLSGTPDLAQTLAVACAALSIPFSFSGIRTLRDKETDRIEALQAEMAKIGIKIDLDNNDTISWDGSHIPILELPRIATYGDHRMAMAFAPLSVFVPGLIIEDVEVVNKSYPNFWHHLQDAGFILEETD